MTREEAIKQRDRYDDIQADLRFSLMQRVEAAIRAGHMRLPPYLERSWSLYQEALAKYDEAQGVLDKLDSEASVAADA